MALIESGWGLDLILWFQAWRTPLVEALGLVFHYLGSEDFYLVIMPVVYWCIDAAFGQRLAVFFLLNAWSNACFKSWWRRPRPFFVSSDVRNVVVESGYGLPSGHTQNSTALWGAIAWQIKRRWTTILVTVFILLMGISRMVLGVHYPQDVTGGLLIGLVWLGLYAWLEPRISVWLKNQGLWMVIGLVVAVTMVMLAIHPGLVPVSSPQWLAEPIPLADLLAGPVTPVGAFLGMGIGFALEVRYVRFNAGGVWWKRLLRLLIGIAGVMVLRFGLGAVFGDLEPALVFRLTRYGLIGLWAGFAAPWVFVKIRLAGKRAE